MNEQQLSKNLERWYRDGDPETLKELFVYLYSWLSSSSSVIRSLGKDEVDACKSELLIKLLDRERKQLERVDKLHAYINSCFRNKLLDALRSKARYQQYFVLSANDSNTVDFPDPKTIENNDRYSSSSMDVHKVLRAAEDLKKNQRLALFLTLAPNRISPTDWNSLHSPPDIPPDYGLDRDVASALLLGQESNETRQARRKRLEHFRKLLERGVAKVRKLLGEEA